MANLPAAAPDECDSYALAPNALLIAQAGEGGEAAEALALGGVRLKACADFAEAADALAEPGLDMIAIETQRAPEGLVESVLARADMAARERALPVIASISDGQIDVAAAHLLGGRAQLLCAPAMAERLAAVALARAQAEQARRGLPRLHDVTRDADALRFRQLHEEVARIADTLAQLMRSEEGERRGVRDSGFGYRGPDEAGHAEVSAQEVRQAIRARRMRAQFFDSGLFADPAWDMLLDLFAAGIERRRVSVSSLCIAAAVPPTTALRWIGALHEAGLFERQADPSDRRRAYIALSPKGTDAMRGYASAVKRAGLSIA